MTRPPYDIIDFHCHHVPPRFALTTLGRRTGAQRVVWERINARIADRAALSEAIESGDLAGRVVNIPAALIAAPDGSVAEGTYQAINDTLAEMVHAGAGRLYGLASIDAFRGEPAAREVTRAMRELKLHGIFVDCAKLADSGDLLLDCAQARPALAEAARLRVPVFVHPIDDPLLARRMAAHGRLGGLFGRGAINAAALIALIEGGVFQALPQLRVVVTGLAIGAIMLEGSFGDLSASADVGALLCRHVLIDTMGFSPAAIRASVDLLGPENVLVGSDWPILNDAPLAARVEQALQAAGLDARTQRLVAADNARRLLSRTA